MPRWLAHLLNPMVRYVKPAITACSRCHLSWLLTKEHTTLYSAHMGCFPLCEHCWQELGAPEMRLPYYQQLVDMWGPASGDIWDSVQQAVLDGK